MREIEQLLQLSMSRREFLEDFARGLAVILAKRVKVGAEEPGVEPEGEPKTETDKEERRYKALFWFSTGYPMFDAGDLYYSNDDLTPLGIGWQEAIAEAPEGLIFGVGNCSGESIETLDKILCSDEEKCVWFNWGYAKEEAYEDPRYMPMVWRYELPQHPVRGFAEKYPGRKWLIFNQPDVFDQANITPEQGAIHYAYLYDEIMEADPTATLLVGGMGFFNYGWLEGFLELQRENPEYSRPIHGIHVHAYPCSSPVSNECIGAPDYLAFYERYDMDLLARKGLAFMHWVESQPELEGKPVWITEGGILSNKIYDPDQSRTRENVMEPTADWFRSFGYNRILIPLVISR